MIYQSDQLTITRLDGDIAELHFDLKGESVNKFDQATVASLSAGLDALEAERRPGDLTPFDEIRNDPCHGIHWNREADACRRP